MAFYAKQQKDLQLVGYYHANERFNDTELGASARKVADKLYSDNSLACAILVRLVIILMQQMISKLSLILVEP